MLKILRLQSIRTVIANRTTDDEQFFEHFLFSACQCNQSLNLLARSEYFRLTTNIPDDQLILSNLFTSPYTLSLIRSTTTTPTLTLTLSKGPVDLSAIRISGLTGEFTAEITTRAASGTSATSTGPIRSTNGVISQCLSRVIGIVIKMESIPISTSKQDFQILLSACETTLRKFGSVIEMY